MTNRQLGRITVVAAAALGAAAFCQGLMAQSDPQETDDFLDLLEQSSPQAAPPDNPGTPTPDVAPTPVPESAPAPSPSPAGDVGSIPVKELRPVESADIPAPRKAIAIEEIVVTAQRREESLQDVPISIAVLDQKQLSAANITNSADIARYTPSVSAFTRFGPENTTFAIRGFAQDLRTTAAVGTYFAEVVAPRGQSVQTSGDGAGPGALFDLQNVQVLRGPQGTLFGRNTTGGAVLLVPKRPTDEVEGYVEMTVGNFDNQRIQSVVNLPLADNFRIRLGIDDNERDGTLNNVTNIGPDELGNVNYTAGRVSALWDVTDNIQNYTILSMTDSDSNGYTAQLFACNNPIPGLLNPSAYDLQQLVSGVLDLLATGDINPLDPVPGVPIGSPFALLTFSACQNQLADQAAAGQNGFYDLANTFKTSITKIRERRVINTTTWDINDDLTFKNIVAYGHLFTNNGSNVFGNAFPDPTAPNSGRYLALGGSIVSPNVPVTNQQTWVWEGQLQGTSFDDSLKWQVGAYFENSTPDGSSGGNTAAFIYCDFATVEGDPSQYDCNDIYQGILGGVLQFDFKTEYLNQAVYGQATYSLSDSLDVTLGLRYTRDETKGRGIKTLYRYNLNLQQAPEITIQTPKVESSAPTGQLEFSYRPFDGIMTYAKYVRGYRQGTVNMAADPGLDTHDPETVDTYEVGFKSTFEWPIPGRFSIALFDNTLTDMQLQGGYISRTSGPTTAIFNAGKGTSRGLEFEFFVQPFEFMTANFSYSYLDTELVESADFCGEVQRVGFLEGFSCTPIADVGDELPLAPKSSYVASLNFMLPVPSSIGEVGFGVTYVYTGPQRTAATSASPFAVLDDFNLLNLNLSWSEMFGEPFGLTLFATNVLDTEYVTYASGTYRTLGIESRTTGQPRTIGARLRYEF